MVTAIFELIELVGQREDSELGNLLNNTLECQINVPHLLIFDFFPNPQRLLVNL